MANYYYFIWTEQSFCKSCWFMFWWCMCEYVLVFQIFIFLKRKICLFTHLMLLNISIMRLRCIRYVARRDQKLQPATLFNEKKIVKFNKSRVRHCITTYLLHKNTSPHCVRLHGLEFMNLWIANNNEQNFKK